MKIELNNNDLYLNTASSDKYSAVIAMKCKSGGALADFLTVEQLIQLRDAIDEML